MKEGILRKYETAKETAMHERLPIPKIKHDKHAKEAIATANIAIDLIETQLPIEVTLTNINHLLYECSCDITASLGIKKARETKSRKTEKPTWQKNKELDIQRIRGEASVLTEVNNDKHVNERKKLQFFRRLKIEEKTETPTIIRKLKLVKHRGYTKRNRFHHRNTFQRKKKQLQSQKH